MWKKVNVQMVLDSNPSESLYNHWLRIASEQWKNREKFNHLWVELQKYLMIRAELNRRGSTEYLCPPPPVGSLWRCFIIHNTLTYTQFCCEHFGEVIHFDNEICWWHNWEPDRMAKVGREMGFDVDGSWFISPGR